MNEKLRKCLDLLNEFERKISFGQVLSICTLTLSIFILIVSIQAVTTKGQNKLLRFGTGIFTSTFTLYSAYLFNKNKDKFDF